MEDITLQALLEAGCHFGHKAERWHPKASSFIYTEKDGIHIIDLAKTKAGLEAAAAFITELVAGGGELLFVATKRQAQGVVKQEAEAVGASYLTARWIGGFLTNWDNIHKNIEKINRLTNELESGAWKKYPKHERTKVGHYLERIKVSYGGVLQLGAPPAALFVVDIKKEDTAVREAKRRGVPVVAVVDTNSDPGEADYVIPANDDAVGSISYIAHIIAAAYKDGKDKRAKEAAEQESKAQAAKAEAAKVEKKEDVVETKPSEVKKEPSGK